MSVSKRLRFEIFRRDSHACRYCGSSAPDATLTIDHVVPVTLGGSDDPSNLVTACKDCNSGKSASNPNAELVAGVADDALRWARAQHLAAEQMLENLEARDSLRAQFKARWDMWQGGDGKPVTLPGQWGASVDRFLSLGLPMPVLLDCIDKAMHNKRIRYDDLFRYMCGIAWKRVEELRSATSALVAQPETTVSVSANSPYRDAIDLMIGFLSGPEKLEQPDVVARWSLEFRDAHAEDEDDDGYPIDYSSWDDEVCATVRAFELDSETAFGWIHTALDLVEMLPGERSEWLAKSRAWHLEHGETDPDWVNVVRGALILATREHVASTTGLPEPKSDPWAEN